MKKGFIITGKNGVRTERIDEGRGMDEDYGELTRSHTTGSDQTGDSDITRL